MSEPTRPTLETDAKLNALEQLRIDLMIAIDRSHLDIADARKTLEAAQAVLKTAEDNRDRLNERLRATLNKAPISATCGALMRDARCEGASGPNLSRIAAPSEPRTRLARVADALMP